MSEVVSLLHARLLQHISIKINVHNLLFENDSFNNVYNSNHPVIFTKFQGFFSFQNKSTLFLKNHLNNLVGLAVHFYCTLWTLLKLSDPGYLEMLFSLLMEITAIGDGFIDSRKLPHRQLWGSRPVKEAKVSQSTPTCVGEDPLDRVTLV